MIVRTGVTLSLINLVLLYCWNYFGKRTGKSLVLLAYLAFANVVLAVFFRLIYLMSSSIAAQLATVGWNGKHAAPIIAIISLAPLLHKVLESLYFLVVDQFTPK